MNRSLAVLLVCGVCLVCPSWGQEQSQKVEITKTESAEFPSGGTLRLAPSVGEVWIEGWDQPGFEITTTKFIKADVPAADVEKDKKELENVKVTFARDGANLVVRTDYPHRFELPLVPYPDKGRKFDIEYRIRVPRAAAVVVDRHSGELHIDDVTGNITASVGGGLIALRLPASHQLSVDAKSTWGAVISDFTGSWDGKSHCRGGICSFGTFPFGHRLDESTSAPQQKLNLRIGFGDILILKEDNPPLPKPLT